VKRELSALSDRRFQLAVVGGGVFGAAVARDAALRGLSVALVEKADFMTAASGNSYRMVHGGIRYLQHGDLRRVRASARERRILLATAPHLVAPLPIAIPTFGHGMQGRAVLRAGIAAYDLLTWDRNRDVREPTRQIRTGRTISRREVERLFPGVEKSGMTGAGVFADAQLQHPQRLGIGMLESATRAGAAVANYAEATRVAVVSGRVEGLDVRDGLSGDAFRIEAEAVVVAAGAWSERLLGANTGIEIAEPSTFSRDLCLVVDRPAEEMGIAVLGGTSDPDAVFSRSRRHLFVVPWRGRSIVGVWHLPYDRSPDDIVVGEDELTSFLGEINAGYPGLELERSEVTHYNTGLVLFGRNRPGAEDLRYGHRSSVTDYGASDGVDGLYSLIGVRYTTARAEAEALLDRIIDTRGWRATGCVTASSPVPGGDIDSLETLAREYRDRWPGLDSSDIDELLIDYGTEVPSVLEAEGSGEIASADVLHRTVRHAVRNEMAVRLEDVVVRRTSLGLFGPPPADVLRRAAGHMAEELAWNAERIADEIDAVRHAYPLSSDHAELGVGVGA